MYIFYCVCHHIFITLNSVNTVVLVVMHAFRYLAFDFCFNIIKRVILTFFNKNITNIFPLFEGIVWDSICNNRERDHSWPRAFDNIVLWILMDWVLRKLHFAQQQILRHPRETFALIFKRIACCINLLLILNVSRDSFVMVTKVN